MELTGTDVFVEQAKTIRELIDGLGPGELGELLALQTPTPTGKYLHWDDLRHREPPNGVTHDQWWLAIKLARMSSSRELPILSTANQPGTWVQTDDQTRLLHVIDQRCSGSIAMPEQILGNEHARNHYLINSLMEEAIRSSQIEGAATTRKVAKEMLRTGRQPKSRDERMIVNNYAAMRFIDEMVGEQLTPRHIKELQRILTDGTLDDPQDSGRFQRPEDERVVVGEFDGSVIYRPPEAVQIAERIAALCEFANEENSPERFVHPVVRAIVLHFWLAYVHPFADGNGRTSRALFYWKMRSENYWLVEYLSISEIIRKAVRRYVKSYVHTETDEFDLTYFIDHQLHVIERALGEFSTHVQQQIDEVRKVERLIRDRDLNYRQRALLGAAIRNPSTVFTFRSHATSHGVVHETARRDLLDLEAQKLLIRRKAGRAREYIASPGLSEILEHKLP